MTTIDERPTTSVDIFSEEVSLAPYAAYKNLRDQARAIYVPEHDYWMLTRYDDVRAAANDWESYSSASGAALLDDFNRPMLGGLLASDPPRHTVLRNVLAEQLSPRGVAALRDHISERVEEIVEDTIDADRVDGAELTRRIPHEIVGDLIGLAEDDRGLLVDGADATFAVFGPFNAAVQERMPTFLKYQEWMAAVVTRDRLRPGSWGAAILDAADDGRLPQESAGPLIQAYLVAGIDTTMNGLAALLHHLASQPERWAAVREHPELAGPAFEEALRLESPVQGFFRLSTRDIDYDGTTIPAGSRVFLSFASANRDERHYPDPDDFILDRNPIDHIAFGYGVHGCAGQALARLEARALIASLAKRVANMRLAAEPTPRYNPVVRGLATLPLVIERVGVGHAD